MTAEIVKVTTATVDVGQQAANEWSKERRDLVKRTVAPDATDAELEMFLHIASRSGLDPLRKQIHFMKHGGRVTIVADINGLQARAAREADFEGIAHACVYEGEDFVFNHKTQEVEKHVSNPFATKGKLLGAWAIVYRKGMKPFADVSRFDEFLNANNSLWRSKPAVMMDKVAKSRALRLAYPEQLGNVYESAEVDAPEQEAPLASATLSKPPLPATTATREAAPTLERTPEKVTADVVEAETVPSKAADMPSREVGSDDGDEEDPIAKEAGEIAAKAQALTALDDAYAALKKRAEALPKGTPERKKAGDAMRAAYARITGNK